MLPKKRKFTASDYETFSSSEEQQRHGGEGVDRPVTVSSVQFPAQGNSSVTVTVTR